MPNLSSRPAMTAPPLSTYSPSLDKNINQPELVKETDNQSQYFKMHPLPPLQPSTSTFCAPYQQNFTQPVSYNPNNTIVDSRKLFPQRFFERNLRVQCKEVKHEEDQDTARGVICKPQTKTKKFDEFSQKS